MLSRIFKRNIVKDHSNLVGGDQYNTSIYMTKETEDFGVIQEIFNYVLRNRFTKRTNIDRRFLDTQEKISINFEEDEHIVKDMFNSFYPKILLVDDCFKTLNPFDQNEIHDDVHTRYLELKVFNFSNIAILTELCKGYTPSNRITNPEFRNMAKAIVLFLFEDCSWGIKTQREIQAHRPSVTLF